MGDCQLAMDTLKKVIPRLQFLSPLISLHQDLNVHASTSAGWGVVLSQLQSDGDIHNARFESGIWSDVERKYDVLKLECPRLLKNLKKFALLVIWQVFHGPYRFTNTCLASQLTSQ